MAARPACPSRARFRRAQDIGSRGEGFHEVGIDVHRGLAKTGVVGTLVNGSGPTVGLRADVDALPIAEANTFAHASRHQGVMHAAAMMAVPPCCWVLRSTSRANGISVEPSISSSSQRRRTRAGEEPRWRRGSLTDSGATRSTRCTTGGALHTVNDDSLGSWLTHWCCLSWKKPSIGMPANVLDLRVRFWPAMRASGIAAVRDWTRATADGEDMGTAYVFLSTAGDHSTYTVVCGRLYPAHSKRFDEACKRSINHSPRAVAPSPVDLDASSTPKKITRRFTSLAVAPGGSTPPRHDAEGVRCRTGLSLYSLYRASHLLRADGVASDSARPKKSSSKFAAVRGSRHGHRRRCA